MRTAHVRVRQDPADRLPHLRQGAVAHHRGVEAPVVRARHDRVHHEDHRARPVPRARDPQHLQRADLEDRPAAGPESTRRAGVRIVRQL